MVYLFHAKPSQLLQFGNSPFFPNGVHCGTDLLDGLNRLLVRRITDINKADLVVFSIAAASGGRLFAVLEPMGANEIRVLQGGPDVISYTLSLWPPGSGWDAVPYATSPGQVPQSGIHY